MKDEKSVPRNDDSSSKASAEARGRSESESKPAAGKSHTAPLTADEIVNSAHQALNMENGGMDPSSPSGKPRKKKKHSFFHWRHKGEDEDTVPEDDIYYGLQLKPLEEYRREYEETIRLDPDEIKSAEEELLREQEAKAESAGEDHPTESEPPAMQNTEKTAKAPEEEKPAEGWQKSPPENAVKEDNAGSRPDKEPEASAEDTSAKTEAPPENAPEAVSGNEPMSEKRKGHLEKIFRKAGLNAEEMFAEKAEIREDVHRAPQQPPQPLTEPLVHPAVIPGPKTEPDIRPPIEEPSPFEKPEPEESPKPSPVPQLNSEDSENKNEKPDGTIEEPSPFEKPEPEESPKPSPVPQLNSEDSENKNEKPDGTAEAMPAAKTVSAQETPQQAENAEKPEAESTSPSKAQKAAEEEAKPAEETPNAVKEPEKPPRAKDETPAPPAEREPCEHSVPHYRADKVPVHVIELDTLPEALAKEAIGYRLQPIHAPEPIPFPAVQELKEKKRMEPEKEEPPKKPVESAPPIELPVQKEKKEEASEAKMHFRFIGMDEDTDETESPEPEAEEKPPEEEIDDYNKPEDAPSIANDIASNVRKMTLRFIVTGIFTLILAAFGVAWEHPALLTPELHSLFTAKICLVSELIFLVLSVVFCAPAVWSGLSGLFRFRANSDSAASVAVFAAIAENVLFLFTGMQSGCRLYAPLAAFALFLNSAGKLSMAKRIKHNFHFIISSEQKYAVQTFDDYNTAIQFTKEFGIPDPKIVYQSKAGFLEHFLEHSYSTSDPSEHTSQYLAPAGFIGSLLLCIATAVLTKNPVLALNTFTASACVCVPFSGSLSVNLPLARLSKIAKCCGSMAVGWDAIDQFSKTNAVILDAEDIFPRGTVVLNGIQTFAGQRIDEAILGATALTASVGGTLNGLFSQIVKSRTDILPHVEHPAYEDGLGISGKVDGRLILVGNRELLKHHGVDAPSHDYEEKYLRAGKIPVYLAAGGTLVAMFLVFYRTDRRRAVELRRLEYNSINILVRTRDPNITPELIASCFGLNRSSISILPERLGKIYAHLQAHPPKRAPAVFATNGRTTAMMRMLTACTRQKGNISIGVALQTAGAALGFALVAFFTAFSGVGQLSVTALLLFELFWTLAVILVPRIRKP